MKDKYLEYIKVGLLVSILVSILVLNHNIRFFGRAILKTTNQSDRVKPPQKATITKNSGIYVGDFPPCLTITAFVDYECVFCQRFMREVFPKIRENYINTGKVSIEFRNLPLDMHENALPAAKAAICASQKFKYEEFLKEIFKENTTLNGETLSQIMTKIGIEKSDYLSCKNDTAVRNKINFDISECRKNSIGGTPTFVVNGNVYVGLIPYEDFKVIIDKELAKKPSQNTCH